MKSNNDRSKTINHKTTKNYHPRAEDPPLLIICRHIIILVSGDLHMTTI